MMRQALLQWELLGINPIFVDHYHTKLNLTNFFSQHINRVN